MHRLLVVLAMLTLFGAGAMPARAAEHGGAASAGGGMGGGSAEAGGPAGNAPPGGPGPGSFGMAPAPLPPLPDSGQSVFRPRRSFGLGVPPPPPRPGFPPPAYPPPYPPSQYPPTQYPPVYAQPGAGPAPGEAPNRVVTDTRDYCLEMADEVEHIEARRPVLPPDIHILSVTGRRMCEHNLIMGGLQRLRMAWRLLGDQP